MRKILTSFDKSRHHIHIELIVTDFKGLNHSVSGILDTGAPMTEFSDLFLIHTGFIESAKETSVKSGLQTQKYGKINLPSIVICGHRIDNMEIFVSYFEKSWGIDALIGLDFFRRFQITINYLKANLIVEPYKNGK